MNESLAPLADRIHDQLQQLLAAARMKAGLIRRQSAESATIEGLRNIERLLEQALGESSALIEQIKTDSNQCAGNSS